jgi:hypothetical protein
MEEKNNKLTFEIEDYGGNTLMAFQVDVSDIDNPKIINTQNCNHADTDNDYIFESSESLIRIQSNTINKEDKLNLYKLVDKDSKNWSELFYSDAPEEIISNTIEFVLGTPDYSNETIYNVLRSLGYEVTINSPVSTFNY